MKNILRLVKYAKPYWHLLVISAFSTIAITVLNLIGPKLITDLIDILSGSFDEGTVAAIRNLALILAGTYLLRILFRFLNNYLSHKAAWNLVSDMRVKVYDHLQKLSLRYYQDKQTGQLMSRTTNDTATFEMLIAHVVPELFANALVVIGVAVILFSRNVYLALMTLIPIPFLLLGSWVFIKKVRPNFRVAQSNLADLNATLQDNISGMKEIQVFNQQPRKKQGKKGCTKLYHRRSPRIETERRIPSYCRSCKLIGTVIVVLIGGWLAMEGNLSVSDIVGFLLYLNLFYQPIGALARVIEDLQQAFAGAERYSRCLIPNPISQTGRAQLISLKAREI
jgi:ATP-binding cassette subfamily B protein/subfamily B ATP-binding cassette protein MsbA